MDSVIVTEVWTTSAEFTITTKALVKTFDWVIVGSSKCNHNSVMFSRSNFSSLSTYSSATMSAVHFNSMVVHLIFSIAEAHCLYLNNWWGKFSTIRKIKCQDLLVERKKNIRGVKNLNSFLFLLPPSSLQLRQHS